MKTISLIYPPFCTPVSPPYSITNIHAFLTKNDIDNNYVLCDLNCLFHKHEFKELYDYYQNIEKNYSKDEYDSFTRHYKNLTDQCYSTTNKHIREGKRPKHLLLLIEEIGPVDIAAFSIVYSSQVFYAYALITELKKKGIKTVIGGPGVNDKLRSCADITLPNELELLNYIKERKTEHDSLNFELTLDFGNYNKENYLVPELIMPIRTSNTCYYQKCTFCTHHANQQYFEYDLETVERSIVASKTKYVFVVDDMLPKKRLLSIAERFKRRKINWMCQLRPTADLDETTLQTLYTSGLRIIIWGVESANDRILKLMRKGTSKKIISKVLTDSHNAGIKNVCYVMFGFPTESEEEAKETLNFLNEHKSQIDLVSTSQFGLQKGSYIYEHPKEFGIISISEKKRIMLDPKIDYVTLEGMSALQAAEFKKRYKKTLEQINTFPKMMNFFREHMLFISCLT